MLIKTQQAIFYAYQNTSETSATTYKLMDLYLNNMMGKCTLSTACFIKRRKMHKTNSILDIY